jgi:hypothetical protein
MLAFVVIMTAVVLSGIVLALRLRHDAARLRRSSADREVFDEREAASRLRVRTGSVEVSPRVPPLERES